MSKHVLLLALTIFPMAAQTRRVVAISHRGEHLQRPENTIPAFQEAIRVGADFFEADVQTTADGNLFVGWGALPYFSEFAPSGQLLFNAEFPTGVNTYRAYLQPWQSGQSGWRGVGGRGHAGHGRRRDDRGR